MSVQSAITKLELIVVLTRGISRSDSDSGKVDGDCGEGVCGSLSC